MIFPPNRARNRRICCIYARSDCFGWRNLRNQAEISSESWRIHQNVHALLAGRVSWVLKEGTRNRPRVLELGTRVWPLEQLHRVEEGRVREVWVGGRVGWTALRSVMSLSPWWFLFSFWINYVWIKSKLVWSIDKSILENVKIITNFTIKKIY